jgi:acyl-CoA oxidase
VILFQDARLRVRQFIEAEVIPTIDSHVEEAKFPEYLIPKLRTLNLFDYFLQPPYGRGFPMRAIGPIIAELSRGDAGVATMCIVQWGLVMFTIEALGSEEQKAKYLPKLKNLEYIGGWGLTEDKIGSDASNLMTNAKKINATQYKLNGTKRWIGNGNRDILIVWARNLDNQKV